MSPAVLPVSSDSDQRLLLNNIDWPTYDRLLHDLEGHHLRLNYDRGRLEITRTSFDHERWKILLARFIETLTMELDVPIMGVGNFTCRREDLDRGLEPDECWYIAHEAVVRDRGQIDLDVDPPPDLVVEIEVSRSVLNRLGILAALGVPEIWRYDGSRLSVMLLNESGSYTESDSSPTFPTIPLSGFVEHLNRRGTVDETTLVRSFQSWVRQVMSA